MICQRCHTVTSVRLHRLVISALEIATSIRIVSASSSARIEKEASLLWVVRVLIRHVSKIIPVFIMAN